MNIQQNIGSFHINITYNKGMLNQVISYFKFFKLVPLNLSCYPIRTINIAKVGSCQKKEMEMIKYHLISTGNY